MTGKALLFVLGLSAATPLSAQMAPMPGMAMPHGAHHHIAPPARKPARPQPRVVAPARRDPQAAASPLPNSAPAEPVPAPAPAPDVKAPTPPAHDMAAMPDMAGMDHGAHDMTDMASPAPMTGAMGRYAMTREASGTAWQPDSAPMDGLHRMRGPWTLMLHGAATLVRSGQGGPRGDARTFSQSMLMAMASRPAGAHGTLGLRAMLSLDPLMGRRGYPLLFATGETANGRDALVDRQHPHDFLMEVAASYAHDLGGGRSAYLYGGLPGEPALGPPTFMHRLSGTDIPEAPIAHHWFDSTHITFGVVTAGYVAGAWKIEASAFRGREPDQHRWDVETPKLDSWSVRGFWNSTPRLSFQLSTGHLRSPEQLHPGSDEQRTTASASYNLPLARGGNWAATIAWSHKDERPGPALDGWLAETALRLRDRHILFARAERIDAHELFETGPLADDVLPVSKLSAGYAYEWPLGRGPVRLAIGGLASACAYPDRIKPAYGGAGVKSAIVFARLRLADLAD